MACRKKNPICKGNTNREEIDKVMNLIAKLREPGFEGYSCQTSGDYSNSFAVQYIGAKVDMAPEEFGVD